MAVQTPQIQLFQYNGNKKSRFKMVISEELETKIRTFCALSPEREWSGVLFYSFQGNFENGITILAKDMYLMDQGSGVHTEFDLDAPEITRYMVVEGLTRLCMGLIHSHNQMQAFFSGEDSGTLFQHGEHMHNFVSLVVNNAGKYVARLTRQVRFNGIEERTVTGKSVSPVFNTDNLEEYDYSHRETTPVSKQYIEYVDLEIQRPKVNFSNSPVERFGEVNTKCSIQKQSTVIVPRISSADYKEGRQGSLFEEEETGDTFEFEGFAIPQEILEELKSIPWKKLGFDGWVSQLLYGSPFAKPTNIDKTAIARLNTLYKERFPNDVEFGAWFEMWLDFMASDFDVPISKQSEFMDSEEALMYKVYHFLQGKDIVYKDMMFRSIITRLM